MQDGQSWVNNWLSSFGCCFMPTAGPMQVCVRVLGLTYTSGMMQLLMPQVRGVEVVLQLNDDTTSKSFLIFATLSNNLELLCPYFNLFIFCFLTPKNFSSGMSGVVQWIELKTVGIADGFVVGKDCVSLYYLQFTNDTMFFSFGDESKMVNLIYLLGVFVLVSGWKININKSSIQSLISQRKDYKVWIGFLVVPGSNEVSSASFGR